MESVHVRRKSCLLRLRDNCPFRKLRRQTYDVSAANTSHSYWNQAGPSTSNQPTSTVYSERLPRCQRVRSPDQLEAAADVHMEEENQQNQHIPENPADHSMDLGDDVDPETGERAQG